MGFTVIRNVFVLDFQDGSPLHGCTIKARSASVKTLLNIMRMADGLRGDPSAMGGLEADRLDQLFEAFAKQLVWWDLEEEPEFEGASVRPIPCSAEGLTSLEIEMALPIVYAWINGAVAVSGPLERNSTDGNGSEPPPMTMETLEPNPSS